MLANQVKSFLNNLFWINEMRKDWQCMLSGKKHLISYITLSTITCTKSLGRVIVTESIKGHIREYLVYNVILSLWCFYFCFCLACLFLVTEGKSKYGIRGKLTYWQEPYSFSALGILRAILVEGGTGIREPLGFYHQPFMWSSKMSPENRRGCWGGDPLRRAK